MTQLILDPPGRNVALPEVRNGAYTCEEKSLSKDIEMASGRMVREIRGFAYIITYQQKVLSELDKEAFLGACSAGMTQPITCMFLAPDSNELKTSTFLVTDFKAPAFQWSRMVGGQHVPLWADYSVTLREVEAHD